MYQVPLAMHKQDYFAGELVYAQGNVLFCRKGPIFLDYEVRSVISADKLLLVNLANEINVFDEYFECQVKYYTVCRFSSAGYDFVAACGSSIVVFADNQVYVLPYFATSAQAVGRTLYFAFKNIIYSYNTGVRKMLPTYYASEYVVGFCYFDERLVVVTGTCIVVGDALTLIAARIIRCSFDRARYLVAVATAENQVMIYDIAHEATLVAILGEREEPSRCPSALQFAGPYLIVCMEHAFGSIFNVGKWDLAMYRLPVAPITNVLRFAGIFVFFYKAAAYALDWQLNAHSAVLAAGCEVASSIYLDDGFCTIADEASIRGYVVPGYISGGDGPYAGRAAYMSLTIAPISSEQAHIDTAKDFYNFGRAGDTLWPEFFYAAQLSGGKAIDCVRVRDLLCCVCFPGRKDENGIEVYYLLSAGLRLHATVPPLGKQRFMYIASDVDGDGTIYCSCTGVLYALDSEWKVRLVYYHKAFGGHFVACRGVLYTLYDDGVHRVIDGKAQMAFAGAIGVLCVSGEIYFESAGHELVRYADGVCICRMSGRITCVRRFEDTLLVCDAYGVISRASVHL